MFKKINSYYQQIPWKSLREPVNLVFMVFIVIVLLISWSGVKALQTNYNLQKQISVFQQQNTVLQLQNVNQQLQNQYYNSNQYLDITAREEFGLGLPGETELIVPKSVALADLAPIGAAPEANVTINSKQSSEEKNFESWVDFILHRPNTN